jgi:hypothetical protein
MRSIDSTTVAYLQSREGIVPRDFLWITGHERDTGNPVSVGFWSDLGVVSVSVISGETGTLVTRTYNGSGSMISIDPIPLISDLSIRQVRINLSQINDDVLQIIRLYDARFGTVEIHRGFFDLNTRALIAPPLPHFIGTINNAPLHTPPAGEEGNVAITVVSHSRELTRTNPTKRSDESQKLRSGDRFRRHSDVVGQWEFWWGEDKGKVAAAPTPIGQVVIKGVNTSL